MSQGARVFPARMEAFPRIAAFVEEVCGVARVDHDTGLRLRLILEELFTNTIVHGHGGDSDAPVHVALDAQPGWIQVTYEDTGPPFDPLASVAPPRDGSGDPAERPVGGLGLVLVARMASSAQYTPLADGNRVVLVLPTSPAS